MKLFNNNHYIDTIDFFLKDYLDSLSICNINSKVVDAMRYSLFSKSKRIRPILVLEFCRLCYDNFILAKEFCVAVEMIHTYSLIHDDLPCMDDDNIRRGKPSCHIEFGEDIALLAGDALLTHAFHIISKSNVNPKNIIKAINLLSDNIGVCGMIGGQELDLKANSCCKDSYDPLLTYNLKTAKLLQASCALGVLASEFDYDDEKYESAMRYGLNLGLAFQLIDDILDVKGDINKLGKPIGSDIKNNKNTFIDIYGLDYCYEKAKYYTNLAKKELSNFKDNGYLFDLTEYLLIRET